MKDFLWVFTLSYWGFLFGLLTLMIVSSACDDNCKKDDIRCNGDVLEICSDENTWETIYDCQDWEDAETGEPSNFVCCESQNMLDCWSQEECD